MTLASIVAGIDKLRSFAAESQQNGAIGSVTMARQSQRSVQLHPDAVDLGQQSGPFEVQGELPRRTHRSHGVGAGRTNANLENLEDACLQTEPSASLSVPDEHHHSMRFGSLGSQIRLPNYPGVVRRLSEIGLMGQSFTSFSPPETRTGVLGDFPSSP